MESQRTPTAITVKPHTTRHCKNYSANSRALPKYAWESYGFENGLAFRTSCAEYIGNVTSVKKYFRSLFVVPRQKQSGTGDRHVNTNGWNYPCGVNDCRLYVSPHLNPWTFCSTIPFDRTHPVETTSFKVRQVQACFCTTCHDATWHSKPDAIPPIRVMFFFENCGSHICKDNIFCQDVRTHFLIFFEVFWYNIPHKYGVHGSRFDH